MKFKSARVRNFKLLRDVVLDFGHDRSRPLTVIRAENGSGKTSTLLALQWALYGNQGLADPAMRFSPTSWTNGTECEISVQLDFTHTTYNQIAGELVPTLTEYRLLRSVVERPDGDTHNRGPDRPSLFRFSESGLDKVEAPEVFIGRMLPVEMRNIFFTDGDAALTFISPTLSKASKRDQVREAIRSLLGLGLLEAADRHLDRVERRYNSEVAKSATTGSAPQLAERINEIQTGIESVSEQLSGVERQVEELARSVEDADRRLMAALQTGDHDELSRQRTLALEQAKSAKSAEQALKTMHRRLIQDERLSLALASKSLAAGFAELARLHEAGIIPSGSIPVLEERLVMGVCVCGTSLTDGSEARQHLEHLIDQQRGVDQTRKVLTEIHHAASVDIQRTPIVAREWIDQLDELERARLENRRMSDAARDELKVCDEKLAKIDRGDIEEAREDRASAQAAMTSKVEDARSLRISLDGLRAELERVKPEYEALLKVDAKLERFTRRLSVATDMRAVVGGVLEELQQKYLARVAARMNSLFLEMVGADPDALGEPKTSTVFTRADISSGFEIVVYSAEGRTLNPDHELNGASKRALTFAFIWALTEVSQVSAPRFIDTPLGMMSGAVKRRVLELITEPDETEEKQTILFLTRDEIRGVEEVIDSRAALVYTFTNSDHYPKDLVNDPVEPVPTVLRCACDHRQHCDLCARSNDSQYDLSERVEEISQP